MLFEFQLSKETDIEAFLKFMRNKYPTIIGRKRFCAHQEEATKELREDCWGFRVILQPIGSLTNSIKNSTKSWSRSDASAAH